MKKTIILFSLLFICSASFSQTTALTLSFAGEHADCSSSGSYFVFDIIAKSDPGTIFDSCIIDIYCNPAAFGTWICNNNAVELIPAASDYTAVVNNLNSNEIRISLNYTGNSASNGIHLTPNGTDVLVTVKIPIKNCETSTLSFIPNQTLTQPISFHAQPTTPAIGDSIYISPPHYCYDYLGNLDSTCYDTIHSAVTIYNYMKIPYNNNIYATPDINSMRCPAQIAISTPSIKAGTNALSVPANSSILTITGSGFGTEQGIVQVTDVNTHNNTLFILDDSDIVSWSEYKIKIKMPSVMFIDTNHTPGTGNFTITTAVCGGSDQGYFEIPYSIANTVGTSNTNHKYKLRDNIIKADGSPGSYIFRCDTSVSHNIQAYACVKKAIENWNCNTGVNWKLGDEIAIDVSLQPAADGISIIYFSDNFPNDASAIMRTKLHELCPKAVDSLVFNKEADINIRKTLNNLNVSGVVWSYDTTLQYLLAPNEISFYDIILHELGHAHLLNHVIDFYELMYSGASPGGIRRNLSPTSTTFAGAMDVIHTSKSSLVQNTCGYPALINIPPQGNCDPFGSGISSVFENEYKLNIFPNPAGNGSITITYQLSKNAFVQLQIIDCTGREVMRLNDEKKSAGSYTEQVNISELPKGIYLIMANINGQLQTIKFIKL